ncbi:hypothetical protein ACLIA0_05440 [Bacillaceae bacterium W0354]
MITIKSVNEQPRDEFIQFFQQEESPFDPVKEPWAEEYGYFIEVEQEKIGYFVLYPLDNGQAWLRRLVMREQTNPAIFILVFDWISEKASLLGYDELYVHVQDQSKAVLLEMNHFKQIYEPPTDENMDSDWFMKELQK